MADHYNLYIFTGSLENMGSAVATVPTGDGTDVEVVIPSLSASTDYTILMRPVTDAGLETPDFSCITVFSTDVSGDWVGNRPDRVYHVRAEAMAGGVIRLSWSYRTGYGVIAPKTFNLYYDTDSDVSMVSADATESFVKDGLYTHDFTLSDGNRRIQYTYRVVGKRYHWAG
jgi:hypothetical protein